MGRVLLTKDDVVALLAWRDEHKELVRRLPAPLKAVEIAFKHNDIHIKGIRERNWLKLYVRDGNHNLGKAELEIDGKNQLIHRKGKLKTDQENFKSILTGYCTLMAFMVYGKAELVETEIRPKRKAHHACQQVSKVERYTYIHTTS